METLQKQKYLIGFYLSLLVILLICVSATPLLIRHGLSPIRRFIIEEDTLETALIITLFGISFIILRSFINTLKSYQQIMDRDEKEKSKLISRLAEAFRYIGTVNVEINEIESVLCGFTCYPQNKKAFKQLLDRLVTKAMTIAATPWMVVRMIDRHSGQTINEHAVQRPQGGLPSVTMGNRAILEGRPVQGLQSIATRQKNLDLLTVFILQAGTIPEEKTILLIAILNQIEMLFILQRSGCLKNMETHHTPEKQITLDDAGS